MKHDMNFTDFIVKMTDVLYHKRARGMKQFDLNLYTTRALSITESFYVASEKMKDEYSK